MEYCGVACRSSGAATLGWNQDPSHCLLQHPWLQPRHGQRICLLRKIQSNTTKENKFLSCKTILPTFSPSSIKFWKTISKPSQSTKAKLLFLTSCIIRVLGQFQWLVDSVQLRSSTKWPNEVPTVVREEFQRKTTQYGRN